MAPEEMAVALGRMEEKLDAAVATSQRIEVQVLATNGRVRALEIFKARAMTLVALVVLIVPLVASHYI